MNPYTSVQGVRALACFNNNSRGEVVCLPSCCMSLYSFEGTLCGLPWKAKKPLTASFVEGVFP